jgi:3-methyladenine DNA glycosylase AlkD
MAAYMRGKFPFLGIATPERRRLTAAAFAGIPPPGEGELGELLGHLWERPEREYQYAGCDLAAKHAGGCGPAFLDTTRTLITTKSWWDTVDALASGVAGPLVARYPETVAVMDRWIASPNLWLARSAILHQLRSKQRTDAGRLFRYCELRMPDEDFFIRKAIGWALREYSKTDSEAVRTFVAAHPGLSGLSKREALLWLEGRRKAKAAARDR